MLSASILWKDASRHVEAASALKLTAEDLLQFGVIDAMIKEPLGGAHHDPERVYNEVFRFIVDKWQMLKRIPIPLLLEQRYQKFRKMGVLEEKTKETKEAKKERSSIPKQPQNLVFGQRESSGIEWS